MDRVQWEKRWDEVSKSAPAAVETASDLASLDDARIQFLGRKGALTELLRSLKDLPLDAKKSLGPKANQLRSQVEALVETRRASLKKKGFDHELSSSREDLSKPGFPFPSGRLHPVTRTMEAISGSLARLGFSMATGPHVETDENNFEKLNIPADHPSRDMQDTFYVRAAGERALKTGDLPTTVLRTHTSPVQIRTMLAHNPPIRIQAPGRVFRHEAVDASHAAVFHQIEGLYVDKNVSMADLKWTLEAMVKDLYGPDMKTRLRPSYFPFTEPSAEVDLSCLFCKQKGCGICKGTGWIEMLGAGMVHPKVLQACGHDPESWTGFAFGIGVERPAMLLHGIHDIRLFCENDIRFLEQFG